MTGSNGEPAQDKQIAQLVQEIDQAGRSGDADTLHGLLGRARDRLSFYEGFDRVIADNVRRSGELMLESLTLRDQIASEHSQAGIRERAALLDQVTALQDQFAGITSQVNKASQALAALRASLDRDEAGETVKTPIAVGSIDAADAGGEHAASASIAGSVEPETDSSPLAEPVEIADVQAAPEMASEEDDAVEDVVVDVDADTSQSDSWDEPHAIDVIAHDVAKAATALALQNHLRGLEQVNKVDAREFASGVLRLQVSAASPLTREDFTSWDGAANLTIAVLQDQVVELRFLA